VSVQVKIHLKRVTNRSPHPVRNSCEGLGSNASGGQTSFRFGLHNLQSHRGASLRSCNSITGEAQRENYASPGASSASVRYAVIGGLLHLHRALQSITHLGIERRLSRSGRRPSSVIVELGCDGSRSLISAPSAGTRYRRETSKSCGAGCSATVRNWNNAYGGTSSRPTNPGAWTRPTLRAGRWCHLYRAIDSAAAAIDFLAFGVVRCRCCQTTVSQRAE